jgi:hypothetical protein
MNQAGAAEHFTRALEAFRTEAKRHGEPVVVLFSPEFRKRVPFARVTLPKNGVLFKRLPGFAFISVHQDGTMLYFGDPIGEVLKRELLVQASQFYYRDYPKTLKV